MRTVGRSEGVVDVGVVTFDERLDEGGVIRRLARIEPEVVEQGHLGEPLGELRPHRFDAIGRVGLAFRAAEVGAGSDAGPGRQQVAQRRDCRSNAEIVSDVPIADGHIEIGPDQDGLAAEIAQIFQARNVDHSLLASSLRGPLGGLLHRSLFLPDRHGEIDETVAVPGLVVVPAEHLEEVAAALSERSVEHT